MKRLLPNSLFWRLILVLFTGLFLSQIISFMINYEERGQLLSQTESRQSAERIADSIFMLDSLEQNSREQVSCKANVSPQGVMLNNDPLVIVNPNEDTLAVKTFSNLLKESLGSDRVFRVTQIDTNTILPNMREQQRRHGHRMGMGMGRGMHRNMNMDGMDNTPYANETPPPIPPSLTGKTDEHETGISFLVQVKLMDGQWAIFNIYAPKDTDALPKRLLVTLGILLIVVMLISFIAVRWVTRPLHQLANAADALGKNINQDPLPETGPTEIRQASHAFNLMQTRLKHFIQDRTHIFAAMSHDLKTPITRLRLRAEMLDDDEMREKFEKDLKEMELMVTQTLDFMKGLDTKEKPQPLNVMALLESIQEDYSDLDKHVTIKGRTEQPFVGIASLLKRCLVNLIDNAIFYGQNALITIEDSHDYLILRIKDNGPGIAENEQEKVFEPFHRLEQSRNRKTGGTGLGLTITRNIVHTHGGEILLNNHPEGGLEVTITLPRKQINR